MTDVEKMVYDLFCKYGELDEIERKEKLGNDQKFQDAFDHLCELGRISMATVTENGFAKVKFVVDKLRERVLNNSAYYFFNSRNKT
jgi:CRISPR/Cas system-associated protein endoribonuclease Cas2